VRFSTPTIETFMQVVDARTQDADDVVRVGGVHA
jgi:hypothetical protein